MGNEARVGRSIVGIIYPEGCFSPSIRGDLWTGGLVNIEEVRSS